MSRLARILALTAAALSLIVLSRVDARVIVESDLTHATEARSGQTYKGVIRLLNLSGESEQVKLYQTDYGFTSDGHETYGEAGGSQRSNAKWIQIDRNQLTLEPRASAKVYFSVSVPSGGGLNGSYWSMIMVEPIPKGSIESGKPLQENEVRVTQRIRFGVQVITEIGKTGRAELAFSNARLIEGKERRLFSVDVANSGQRWLKPQFWLELYTTDGTPVGKFDGPTKRVFPGTSARFQVDLEGVKTGQYIALVVADGGGDNLFGANVQLKVP